MRASVICTVLGFTSGGMLSCRKYAPTIRPAVTSIRKPITIEKCLRNSRS